MPPTPGAKGRSKRAASSASSAVPTATTSKSKGVRMTQEPLKVTKEKRTEGSSRKGRGQESFLADLSLYSQVNDGCAKSSNRMAYFVLPEGLTEATCDENLAETYTYAVDANIKCQWIKEKDCLRRVPVFGNIFVLSPLSGPAYERLCTFRKREECFVLGPQVLRYLIKDDPDSKTELNLAGVEPPFTVGMRNLLVTLTGVACVDRRLELSGKIEKMMGTSSRTLTRGITHVVADNVLTEKVLKAYEINIPVMKTEWIEAVWEDSQNELIHATHEKYVKYACPIFHNLDICVSQVHADLKEALCNVIEANGGTYNVQLIKNKTSILIVPKAEGNKYSYAQQWNLPCVTPDWIEASKSAGHVRNWLDFAVKKIGDPPSARRTRDDVLTSTPINSMVVPFVTDANNESIWSNINGTCQPEMPTPFVINCDNNEDILKDVAQLMKNVSQREPFLDGCQIYISKNQKSEHIRKLVNASGAMRLNTISDRVTHIILPLEKQLTSSEVQQIKQLDSRPSLVKVQWLVNSAKEGRAADEELFKVDPFNPQSEAQMIEESVNMSYSSQTSKERSVENARAVLTHKSIESGSKATLQKASSSQIDVLYGRDSKGEFIGVDVNIPSKDLGGNLIMDKLHIEQEGIHINIPTEDLARNLGIDDVHIQPPCNDINMDGPYNDDMDESDTGSKIFYNRTFKVLIDDENECAEVVNSLLRFGGILADDCDFVILPPIYTTGIQLSRPILRTVQWVTNCIETGTMDGDILFSHIPLKAYPKMSKIFHGIVVAISQYSNTEKEYLSTLVTAMSGMHQEVFARKESHPVRRTTHLVCSKTDNDKYRAARKWKTPVVVAEWVVDCFTSRAIQEIDSYDPVTRSDSQSTVNYFPQTPKNNLTKFQNPKAMSNKPASGKLSKPPITTPVRNGGNNTDHLFKTPASKPTTSTPKAAADLNMSEELPTTESFEEYCRDHPYRDSCDEEAFQEWLKQQPKTPESRKPEPSSPIMGGAYGMTRSASRHMKAHLKLIGMPSSPNIGMLKLRRRSTPPSQIVRRDMAKLVVPDDYFTNYVEPEVYISTQANKKQESSSSKRPSSEIPTKDQDEDSPTRASKPSKRLKISSSEDSETDETEPRKTRSGTKSTTNDPVSLSDHGTSAPSRSIRSSTSNEREGDNSSQRSDAHNSSVSSDEENSNTQDPNSDELQLPKPLTGNLQEGRPAHSNKILTNLLAEMDDDNERMSNKMSPFKPPSRGNSNDGHHEQEKPSAEELDKPDVVWDTNAHDNDIQCAAGPSQNNRTSPVASPIRPLKQYKTKVFEVPSKPTFLLSGIDEEERSSILDKLSELGGEILDQAQVTSIFAVIANTLTRSEKVLCAIAAGKPLVTSTYVDTCFDAGEFIPITEEFLWKASYCKTPVEKELVKSSENWRNRILKNPADTPFAGDAFFIQLPDGAKKVSFARLVRAGGGVTVTSKDASTIILVQAGDACPGEVGGYRYEYVSYLNKQIINAN